MDKFPIFDPKAPLVGRSAVMQQIINNYAKKSPAHLSLLGPRYSGKSVLLNALVENMRRDKSSLFQIIAYWDLRHQTPESDLIFLQTMCKKIGEELCPIDAGYSGILLEGYESEDPLNELKEVIECLDEKKINILLVCDGCDRPFSNGTLTRNLWDNLLALSNCPNMRYIFASREELYLLLRDSEAKTSNFWQIFENGKIKINIFDEDDQNAVLENLNGIQFKPGVKQELLNWTGGFPPLYLSVLNQLSEMSLKQVDSADVVEAAENILEKGLINNVFAEIWDDCSEVTQELFFNLSEKDVLKSSSSSNERIQLIERGLAKLGKSKITKNCRLMEKYVLDTKNVVTNVARLFKKNDDYQKNIKTVLGHRLNQMEHVDSHLKKLIRRCIEDIPEHPKSALKAMRGILEEGLDLIIKKEFQEEEIPQDWVDTWNKENPHRAMNDKPAMTNKWPSEDWEKIKLIQYMVGAYPGKKTPPRAKYTSLSSYHFLQNIKHFGDYSKHSNNENISVETSVAAIMTCIEFAVSLKE